MSYNRRRRTQQYSIRRMIIPRLQAKVYSNQWSVRSSSDPTKSYKVSLKSDGEYECSCPAWIYKRGEKRDCKHIRQIQGSPAGRIAATMKPSAKPQPSKRQRCPECGEDKKLIRDYDTGEVICGSCGFVVKKVPKQLLLR